MRRGSPQIKKGWPSARFDFILCGAAGSTSAFTCVILWIEHHIDWIADCLAWLNAHLLKTIEATEKAESDELR